MTDLMADRYGSRRGRRGRWPLLLGGLLALAGLVWLAWAIWAQATPQVQSSLRSYDVVGTHSSRAVVAVQLSDRGIKASCHLQAYAADHSVVGDLDFTPPRSRKSSTVTLTMRTERRATSVELEGCTTADQKRPR